MALTASGRLVAASLGGEDRQESVTATARADRHGDLDRDTDAKRPRREALAPGAARGARASAVQTIYSAVEVEESNEAATAAVRLVRVYGSTTPSVAILVAATATRPETLHCLALTMASSTVTAERRWRCVAPSPSLRPGQLAVHAGASSSLACAVIILM